MYLSIPMHLWLEMIFNTISAGNWPFWRFWGCRDTMSQFASWTVPVGRIFRSRVLPWWHCFLAEVAFLYATETTTIDTYRTPKINAFEILNLALEYGNQAMDLIVFFLTIPNWYIWVRKNPAWSCFGSHILQILSTTRMIPSAVDYPQALCDLSRVPGEDGGFASNIALCLWINATWFAKLSLYISENMHKVMCFFSADVVQPMRQCSVAEKKQRHQKSKSQLQTNSGISSAILGPIAPPSFYPPSLFLGKCVPPWMAFAQPWGSLGPWSVHLCFYRWKQPLGPRADLCISIWVPMLPIFTLNFWISEEGIPLSLHSCWYICI